MFVGYIDEWVGVAYGATEFLLRLGCALHQIAKALKLRASDLLNAAGY